MGELIDTEDTQPSTDMPPSQVSSSGGNNNKKANELTVASSNPKSHLTYYGKSTVEQNQAIKEKIFCHLKLSSWIAGISYSQLLLLPDKVKVWH